VLVWFHEHGEGTVADARDVAGDTRTPPESAGSALVSLAARGLLAASSAEPSRFLYAPTRKTHAAVTRIARAYRNNPVEVMGHMTSNAIERVRTAAVRTFAESFRIRRPKSDG
jgi:hypothetical protein